MNEPHPETGHTDPAAIPCGRRLAEPAGADDREPAETDLGMVAAAASIDPELPPACARIEDYLDAYSGGEAMPTGVIGRRKAGDDRIATLRAEDLRTAMDGLGAAIEAACGPSEAASLDHVHRKLDLLITAVAGGAQAQASGEAAPTELDKIRLERDWARRTLDAVIHAHDPVPNVSFDADGYQEQTVYICQRCRTAFPCKDRQLAEGRFNA